MGQLKPSNDTADGSDPAEATNEISTAQLVDQAIEDGYAEARWHALQERLARPVLADLAAAIHSGSIFPRCARAGFRLYPEAILQPQTLADEIAAKAVSKGLLGLRDDILLRGRWEPSRAVSKPSSQLGACRTSPAPTARPGAGGVGETPRSKRSRERFVRRSPRPTPL